VFRLRTVLRDFPAFTPFNFGLRLSCAGCAVGALPALAQTDVNDVHVAPRTVEKSQDGRTGGNRSLVFVEYARTSVAANADLVLVPVTITDPMNRLVTGLERENFQLFEGSAGQEIKTFSSEDAPVSLGSSSTPAEA